MKESNGCNANARNGSNALFADIAFFSFSVLASFVTLCVEVDPDSMVPLRGWTLVSFKHMIVLFTACVLLMCDHIACSKGKRYPFRRKGDTAKPPQLIAALLFALMVLLGQSLDAAESLAPLYETVSSASIALLRFCGLAIFAYRSLDFLMRFLDLINLAAPLNRPLPAWLPYASISACWMIYFILLFPGSIPTDTSRQLAQFFGAEGTVLDNHFPYFTSLVFGLLFQLGTLISNDGIASVALMSGFQIALGVYVYGTIALWINRLKAPKWLAILSIAFFSLSAIPVPRAHDQQRLCTRLHLLLIRAPADSIQQIKECPRNNRHHVNLYAYHLYYRDSVMPDAQQRGIRSSAHLDHLGRSISVKDGACGMCRERRLVRLLAVSRPSVSRSAPWRNSGSPLRPSADHRSILCKWISANRGYAASA